MIKGIDSQIITGRMTDLMKDNSARLKSDEFNQALQSRMQNTDVQKDVKTVTDVKKGEIRKTDDKDDGKKKNGRQGKQQQDEEEEQHYTVTLERPRINNDSNAVSGNENVGLGRISSIDIEI